MFVELVRAGRRERGKLAVSVGGRENNVFGGVHGFRRAEYTAPEGHEGLVSTCTIGKVGSIVGKIAVPFLVGTFSECSFEEPVTSHTETKK